VVHRESAAKQKAEKVARVSVAVVAAIGREVMCEQAEVVARIAAVSDKNSLQVVLTKQFRSERNVFARPPGASTRLAKISTRARSPSSDK
jgi:aspartate ammonia-lyase